MRIEPEAVKRSYVCGCAALRRVIRRDLATARQERLAESDK